MSDQYEAENDKGRMRLVAIIGIVAVLALAGAIFVGTKMLGEDSAPDDSTSQAVVEVRMQTMQSAIDSLRGEEARDCEFVALPTSDHLPVKYGDTLVAADWTDDMVTVTLTGGDTEKQVHGFLVGDKTATISGMERVAGEYVLDRRAFGGEIPDDGSLQACLSVT